MSDTRITELLGRIGLTPDDLEPEVLAIVREHIDEEQPVPSTPRSAAPQMQERVGTADRAAGRGRRP